MATQKSEVCLRLDASQELDEIFIRNASVHIERMNETGFWIGIEGDGVKLMVNTGVERGRWFFNVEEDSVGGAFHSVERPRRADTKAARQRAATASHAAKAQRKARLRAEVARLEETTDAQR